MILMMWLTRVRRWLGGLVRRTRFERDMSEEMAHHLELEVRDRIAGGMTPAEARRTALRDFGGVERWKEEARSVRGLAGWDALRQDLRYAVRTLRKSPGFTLAAVFTLALGIGANTAIFSVVNGVLLGRLPYTTPDRVVMLRGSDPDGAIGVSERERLRYRHATDLFARVGTYTSGFGAVRLGDEVERVPVGLVDADVFPALGVEPFLGRGFTAEEDAAGGPRVVLLSYDFWQRRYAGDRAVVGDVLELDGEPWTVVGVMPATFRLPGAFLGSGNDLYTPLALGAAPDPRNLHYLSAVARLAPGLRPERLRSGLATLSRELREGIGTLPPGFEVQAVPVRRAIFGQVRPALLALLGAVGLVLLIACANVANLLLVRWEGRARELSIRAALGAGRGRLGGLVLLECLLIGLGGGFLGLLVAAGATRGLVALSPPNLPRLEAVAVDWRVLTVALALAVLTGLLVGIVPAFRAGRSEVQRTLRETGPGAGGGRHGSRVGLVVAETALAVMLAIGAGLLIRSFVRLQQVDRGFAPEHVLTMQLSLPASSYPDPPSIRRFYEEVLDRVDALPGVGHASATSRLPLRDQAGDWGIRIAGREEERLPGGRHPWADWIVVSEGYCAALGVTVREGRCIEAEDRRGTRPVVVINETMARRYWPDGSAVGGRFRLSSNVDTVYRTVVGVVSDVRQNALDEAPEPTMYLPHAQFPSSTPEAVSSMTLVVRTLGDPVGVVRAVAAQIRSLDSAVPVSRVRTMDQVLARSTSVARLEFLLFTAFGVLGLVLVAVGVYAVTAHAVAARTREMGIRRALGASAGRIQSMVVAQGMARAGAGVLLGVAAAIALSRLLAGLLYGVGVRDLATFTLVPLLVTIVALGACYLPARRTTRMDPMTVLREQ